MFLKNYKKNTFIILLMIIYALIVPRLSYHFRFINDYRWIYHFGTFSGFAFYFISMTSSMLNTIYILTVEANWNKKVIMILLTLIPFYVFYYVFYC